MAHVCQFPAAGPANCGALPCDEAVLAETKMTEIHNIMHGTIRICISLITLAPFRGLLSVV
jgi:hypothetical protein